MKAEGILKLDEKKPEQQEEKPYEDRHSHDAMPVFRIPTKTPSTLPGVLV